MLETILCLIGIVGVFVLCTYLVSTKDRRIDYLERERIKRDVDIYKWL